MGLCNGDFNVFESKQLGNYGKETIEMFLESQDGDIGKTNHNRSVSGNFCKELKGRKSSFSRFPYRLSAANHTYFWFQKRSRAILNKIQTSIPMCFLAFQSIILKIDFKKSPFKE